MGVNSKDWWQEPPISTATLGGMFGRTNFVSGRFISKSLPMNIQIAHASVCKVKFPDGQEIANSKVPKQGTRGGSQRGETKQTGRETKLSLYTYLNLFSSYEPVFWNFKKLILIYLVLYDFQKSVLTSRINTPLVKNDPLLIKTCRAIWKGFFTTYHSTHV